MGEAQSQPKLQQMVAKLKKRQQEEVELRAKADGTNREAEVAQAKKGVQTAQRDVKDEHGRIYQKVMAEHERYMERAVRYKSLRYNWELAKAGRPQEITGARLRDGRVTSNKRRVLAEVAGSTTRGSRVSARSDRLWSGRCHGCSHRKNARPYTIAE